MKEQFDTYFSKTSELESTLSTLSEKQLSFKAAKDKWSINEVLAHLVDTEIQAYTRFRSILADDVPFLVNHNEAKWTTPFNHNKIDAKESLSIFKLIRKINHNLIASLNDSQLAMEGLHSTRGRMTVKNLIEAHIKHLEKHIGQINRNLTDYVFTEK